MTSSRSLRSLPRLTMATTWLPAEALRRALGANSAATVDPVVRAVARFQGHAQGRKVGCSPSCLVPEAAVSSTPRPRLRLA
jgi:hypothetical protein